MSRYDAAFRLMHKLRVVLRKGDALYPFPDILKMDEANVGIATEKRVKQNLNRGNGSQRKASVVVSAESLRKI